MSGTSVHDVIWTSSFLLVVGGKMFGNRFVGISFVNVIQMLTEMFYNHALGFTNKYSVALCTSDGVFEIVFDAIFTFGTMDDVSAVSEVAGFTLRL